jgi:hypothetical protein
MLRRELDPALSRLSQKRPDMAPVAVHRALPEGRAVPLRPESPSR